MLTEVVPLHPPRAIKPFPSTVLFHSTLFLYSFVRLMSHVSVTGLDVTLPGVGAACVSDRVAPGHVTEHSSRYGPNAVYSECAVMWALHRAYGISNVSMIPAWASD